MQTKRMKLKYKIQNKIKTIKLLSERHNMDNEPADRTPLLLPAMTLWQNVALGAKWHSAPFSCLCCNF